ncbi:hypothetical protein AALO_G00179100 [Alosa alosa]|uniref:Alkylated DNA repair protein AlkB homologue 8 N-terminal domain-containing protein n=1 Tax=Alosa alosa TaxID=278164 RepID=A0AAV6GCZ5_9TELE|nr:hypothetical protein AALO_G00179100 [Alosa alosa]
MDAISAPLQPAPQSCESNIPLLNNLNRFFARFEAQNSTCPQKTHPPLHEQPLCLSADSVKRTLAAINTRKATGPDNIPGRALKDCAGELKDVFTDIFNTSLKQAIIPSCFKAATIIPVPKKTAPSCFNDYRPVALTPIIMKCFERLVMSHIKSIPPPTLDPFQFAYRAKRSTEDAICSALHLALTHLEKRDSYGDETQYRLEVDHLTTWCRDNNLLLNVSKTKEIVVDFRRGHTQHLPLTINGVVVERASSTKFLGVHISEDLSWTTNTASLAKRAQRRLYFLRKLRRASAPPAIMTTFYRGTIESILSSCIAVWGGSCTEYNRKALQRIVNTAGRIIGASLPSLKDIYTTHLTRKATKIVSDASHPAHNLFDLLPSGKRIFPAINHLLHLLHIETVRLPGGSRELRSQATVTVVMKPLFCAFIILLVCCIVMNAEGADTVSSTTKGKTTEKPASGASSDGLSVIQLLMALIPALLCQAF